MPKWRNGAKKSLVLERFDNIFGEIPKICIFQNFQNFNTFCTKNECSAIWAFRAVHPPGWFPKRNATVTNFSSDSALTWKWKNVIHSNGQHMVQNFCFRNCSRSSENSESLQITLYTRTKKGFGTNYLGHYADFCIRSPKLLYWLNTKVPFPIKKYPYVDH